MSGYRRGRTGRSPWVRDPRRTLARACGAAAVSGCQEKEGRRLGSRRSQLPRGRRAENLTHLGSSPRGVDLASSVRPGPRSFLLQPKAGGGGGGGGSSGIASPRSAGAWEPGPGTFPLTVSFSLTPSDPARPAGQLVLRSLASCQS